MDYRELMGIIVGYVTGSFLSCHLIIESDSLLAVNILPLMEKISRSLELYLRIFLGIFIIVSLFFSHFLGTSNSLAHLLAESLVRISQCLKEIQ